MVVPDRPEEIDNEIEPVSDWVVRAPVLEVVRHDRPDLLVLCQPLTE